MKRKLVLITNRDLYYFGCASAENIDVREIFCENRGALTQFLIKLTRKLFPSFLYIFYGDWYKRLNEYEKVIMMDDIRHRAKGLPYDLLPYIKKYNIEGYVYSWNVVKTSEAEKWLLDLKKYYPVYHYDEGMCKKYGFKFNTIMYSRNVSQPKSVHKYDAFFLGFAKDRENELIQIHKKLISAGMKPRFYVFGSNTNNPYEGFEYLDGYVNYKEYLNMMSECSIIVDIAQSNQDGFSMRVMESIFFDKKLISTNKALKNAGFFSSNNILVMDKNVTDDEIKRFLYTETVYSEEWKDYYSFEKWVERFD